MCREGYHSLNAEQLIRNYERYGLLFSDAIGFRIDPDGSQIPLFYGEIKIDVNNRYHPIPRTRPSTG